MVDTAVGSPTGRSARTGFLSVSFGVVMNDLLDITDVDVCVLGDEGSTTESLRRLGLPFLHAPRAPSILSGRKTCVEMARKKFIWLIDDDDEVLPEILSLSFPSFVDIVVLNPERYVANWARIVKRELFDTFPWRDMNSAEDAFIWDVLLERKPMMYLSSVRGYKYSGLHKWRHT